MRSRLGFAAVFCRRGEKAAQIGPAISRRLDRLAGHAEELATDRAAAETFVEKPAGIVAQYPDERRRTLGGDQAAEQGIEDRAADAAVLPVRRDIEREDLA